MQGRPSNPPLHGSCQSVIIDSKKIDERSDFELELEAAISKQPMQRQAKHNVTKLILAQYRKILVAKK